MVERVIHIARSHKEAEEWDIVQQLEMTPDERQRVAKELRKRFYGEKTIDVRASRAISVFRRRR
jgi:hypothetical protein